MMAIVKHVSDPMREKITEDVEKYVSERRRGRGRPRNRSPIYLYCLEPNGHAFTETSGDNIEKLAESISISASHARRELRNHRSLTVHPTAKRNYKMYVLSKDKLPLCRLLIVDC